MLWIVTRGVHVKLLLQFKYVIMNIYWQIIKSLQPILKAASLLGPYIFPLRYVMLCLVCTFYLYRKTEFMDRNVPLLYLLLSLYVTAAVMHQYVHIFRWNLTWSVSMSGYIKGHAIELLWWPIFPCLKDLKRVKI